jgi:soluble lytic murein transglycosylase-like protein
MTAEQLAKALRASVDVASGRQPVQHCRGGVRDWTRCDARLEAFAAAFVASGRRHGVPPEVLAAIAVGESGLNPHAVGAAGEIGIMQLHPRGVGRVLARSTCSPGRVDA